MDRPNQYFLFYFFLNTPNKEIRIIKHNKRICFLPRKLL